MEVAHSWPSGRGAAMAAASTLPSSNPQGFYVSEAKRLARQGKLMEMVGLMQERVEEAALGDARTFLHGVGIHAVRGGCVAALERRRLPYVLEFCRALGEFGIFPPDFLGKHGLQLIVNECARMLQEDRVEECIRCLEKLSKCGFIIKNLVKPTICMEACARMHNSALALRYASLLPDILQSYNMIMQKFRDQGDLQSVFHVFKAMEPVGVRPDMYSYCILIDACGRCGEASRATAIFEELLKSGVVLNVYVCNSMMNAHAESIQLVLRLYRQMQCSGIAADVTTYNIVLKACRLSKNHVVALRLYEELKAKGVRLNVQTYGTLIQIFGEAKMLDQVFRIKLDMDTAGVVPNVVTWTSLVGACAKAALVEKTLQVFRDMVKADCVPNNFTYNFLLSACVDGSQPEKAEKLFNEWKSCGRIFAGTESEADSTKNYEFVPLDSVAYNTMMRACDKSPEQVEAIMQEIEKSGGRPDKRSWCILINSYGCNGNKQGAIQAFERMRKSGIIPDVVTYTAIIKACVNAQDVSMALRFYETMKHAGVSPNSVTYNTLLRARRTGDLRETQRILGIYEEMRESGCAPNERILKSLIEDWAEDVIKRNLNARPGDQVFKEYGESILRKVSVTRNPGQSFVIDIQGLSKAEARAAVLVVLRILKEQHNGVSVEEDLIIVTGPWRRSEARNAILENVVTQVLENQLGLPVFNLGEFVGGGDVEVRKPETFGRLKIPKQALNAWIARKKS